MKYLLTLITLLLGMQVVAYQSPYQQAWFDGVWRKNCKWDKQQQMCISESENFKNLQEYNNYWGTNKYYCRNGYLYQRIGNSQQSMLQTNSYGKPLPCDSSLQEVRPNRIQTGIPNFGNI